MADCLMYWKYYWTDMDENPGLVNLTWHTGSEHFLQQVEPGDSLLVVITGGPHHPGEWRLLQRLVVKSLADDGPPDTPYHVAGDPAATEHYDVVRQADLSPILHQLNFQSGKKIELEGATIGRALQAIRPLTDSDISLLEEYSRDLKRR